MDIVIPHIKGHWNSIDLKYTLRSIAKFYPEAGSVYLIGEHAPSWYCGEYIWTSTDTDIDRPFVNTRMKLGIIAVLEHISEDFLWIDDDMLLIAPYYPCVYHRASTKQWSPGHYKRAWERTCEELTLRGVEHIRDFDIHVPMVYGKKKVVDCYTDEPLLMRSLYGNLHCPDSIPIEDQKPSTWDGEPSGKFVSVGDLYFGTEPAREWGNRMFPDPSPWEK